MNERSHDRTKRMVDGRTNGEDDKRVHRFSRKVSKAQLRSPHLFNGSRVLRSSYIDSPQEISTIQSTPFWITTHRIVDARHDSTQRGGNGSHANIRKRLTKAKERGRGFQREVQTSTLAIPTELQQRGVECAASSIGWDGGMGQLLFLFWHT